MSDTALRKIQTQGVHHITLTRRRPAKAPSTSGKACWACPSSSTSPNLDDPNEGHLYSIRATGRLITIFTNENPHARSKPVPEAVGLAPPTPPSTSARRRFWQIAARLDARGVRHSGPGRSRVHGFDLFPRSAGAEDRTGQLPFRAARRVPPRRCDDRGAQDPGGPAATTTSTGSIWPTPSRRWWRAVSARCPTIAGRAAATERGRAGSAWQCDRADRPGRDRIARPAPGLRSPEAAEGNLLFRSRALARGFTATNSSMARSACPTGTGPARQSRRGAAISRPGKARTRIRCLQPRPPAAPAIVVNLLRHC